jgi:ATP-binding cassette, subfamily B (MDR/TAP), member 1
MSVLISYNFLQGYPRRPDVPVLQDFSMKIQPGQTIAIVGRSGCGKSTIMKLIERCFDVKEGKITVDGVDIKTMNVRWLRQQMAVVNQVSDFISKSFKKS